MAARATIEVPREGRAWLTEVAGPGEGAGAEILVAPAGVAFDSLETARALGAHLLSWLRAERRPVGPVALDTIAGRMRFLVPPGARSAVPDVVAELVGAGRHVRLPGPVTASDACLRWLVPPGERHPRLTDPDDLLAGIAACLHVSAGVPRSHSLG
jgi:hypothetical protein